MHILDTVLLHYSNIPMGLRWASLLFCLICDLNASGRAVGREVGVICIMGAVPLSATYQLSLFPIALAIVRLWVLFGPHSTLQLAVIKGVNAVDNYTRHSVPAPHSFCVFPAIVAAINCSGSGSLAHTHTQPHKGVFYVL